MASRTVNASLYHMFAPILSVVFSTEPFVGFYRLLRPLRHKFTERMMPQNVRLNSLLIPLLPTKFDFSTRRPSRQRSLDGNKYLQHCHNVSKHKGLLCLAQPPKVENLGRNDSTGANLMMALNRSTMVLTFHTRNVDTISAQLKTLGIDA